MLAADAIRRGEVIVLPTDTVYGVGADAFDRSAVRARARRQGPGQGHAAAGAGREPAGPRRPGHGPPALRPRPGRRVLARRPDPRLPGPAVARLGPRRDGTVAVRMPLHRTALALLDRTGPLAVTSANQTGQPAATTCDEAEEQLGRGGLGLPRRRPLRGQPGLRPSSTSPATGPGVLRVGAVDAGPAAHRRTRSVGRPAMPEPVEAPAARRGDRSRPEAPEPTG